MDIKSNPQVNVKAAAQPKKEERTIPTRSFKEVMAHKEVSRFPTKRKSVFELASKEKKKRPPEPNTQHGEHAKEISPQGVLDGMEVSEVQELSLEVLSLIEEMADYVKIESEGGVSTTTVKLGMEGSVFQGSEIIIDHYDTAPHSFNLLLTGSPEAADLFTAHLGTLQLSLNAHEALKGFQVNLLQPVLSEKSDLYSRGMTREERKKAAKLKGVGGSLSQVSKK